jgi:hypothetical protein
MMRKASALIPAAALACLLAGCTTQPPPPDAQQSAQPTPPPPPKWKGNIHLTTTDTLGAVLKQVEKQSGIAYKLLDSTLETTTVAVTYDGVNVEAVNADLAKRLQLSISMPPLGKTDDNDTTPTAEVRREEF